MTNSAIFCVAGSKEAAAKQPKLSDLRSRLLSFGGEEFVARSEPDLDALLSKGTLMAAPVRLEPMVNSSCHENVSRLWLKKVVRLWELRLATD